MRFFVLVVGEDVAAALEPFRDHDQHPPYTRECLCRRIKDDRYDQPPSPHCAICHGAGTMATTLNPIGFWDRFRVDDDELGGGSAHMRKHELDLETLLESGWGTYAIVIDGVWHQDGRMHGFPSLARLTDRVRFHDDWGDRDFESLVRALPDDAMLTVVECHG